MSLKLEISHAFGDFSMNIALRAQSGVTAIFGRSGAGKSTLVNIVAGLLRPDYGRVALNDRVLLDTNAGVDVPPHQRGIGYVFQEGRLFPHLNVRSNLLYGRRFAGRRKSTAGYEEMLELLGIAGLAKRYPHSLSGGEKQRVAIGRALLSNPDLLIMDEPLASLDEQRKNEILPYLESLRDEIGLPILYVSHNVSEIARLADVVIVLRNGKLVRHGSAEEVFADPASAPTLGVRDAGALLRATVMRHHEDGLTELSVSAGSLFVPRLNATANTHLRIRILAHDIILSLDEPHGLSALNTLPVTLEEIRKGDGPGVAISMKSGSDRLLARITGRSAQQMKLQPGMQCYAIMKSVAVAQENIGTAST